jgi:hypothetical protein
MIEICSSTNLKLCIDLSCENIIHHDIDKNKVTFFLANDFYKSHLNRYILSTYNNYNIISIPDILKEISKSNNDMDYDIKIKITHKSLNITRSTIYSDTRTKINLKVVIPLNLDFIQYFKKEIHSLSQIINVINNLSYDNFKVLKEFRPYEYYKYTPLYYEINIPTYGNSFHSSTKILKNISNQKIEQYEEINIDKELGKVKSYHKRFFKHKVNKLKFSYEGASFNITREQFKVFDYYYKVHDSSHILKYLYLIGQLNKLMYDIESCKLSNI